MIDPVVSNNYFTKPDRRPLKFPDRGEIDDVLKLYGSREFPYVLSANSSTEAL